MKKEIIEILSDIISVDEVTSDMFLRDIADSLDLIEVGMRVEEDTGIYISDSIWPELETVGDLIRYVTEKVEHD